MFLPNILQYLTCMLTSRKLVSFIYQIIHELPEAVKSLKAVNILQTMGNVQHSPLTLQGHLFFDYTGR